MRATRKPHFKPRRAYAVVVDGKCETWYLDMLQRNEPSVSFRLDPKIPQKKRLQDQYERVKQLAPDYHKVFWIIDCDVITAETRLVKKGVETPQQVLERHIKSLKRDYKNKVVIIRNKPCLEYWLLLHFEDTASPFTDCEQAGKRLKKHITAYEKTQGFYTKQDKDIYLQLKPHLSKALKRAAKITELARGDMQATISEMHLLFEELGIK